MNIVDGVPLLKNLDDKSIEGMYNTTVDRASTDNCIFMIYKPPTDEYIYFSIEGIKEENNLRKDKNGHK